MSLDAATVKCIAHLARIRVSDAEVAALAGELGAIIGWVEQLGEIDVEGIEPMTGARQMALAMRDDIVTEPDRSEALLANAPDRARGFFAVPKVVE